MFYLKTQHGCTGQSQARDVGEMINRYFHLVLAFLGMKVDVSPLVVQIRQLGSELLGLLPRKRLDKVVSGTVQIIHVSLLFCNGHL